MTWPQFLGVFAAGCACGAAIACTVLSVMREVADTLDWDNDADTPDPCPFEGLGLHTSDGWTVRRGPNGKLGTKLCETCYPEAPPPRGRTTLHGTAPWGGWHEGDTVQFCLKDGTVLQTTTVETVNPDGSVQLCDATDHARVDLTEAGFDQVLEQIRDDAADIQAAALGMPTATRETRRLLRREAKRASQDHDTT